MMPPGRRPCVWPFPPTWPRPRPRNSSKLITDLAGEMKNKRRPENTFLKIDLPDFIAGKGYVLIGPSGQPIHVEEYRRRVEQRILAIAETHPALVAIREGRQPTADQLVDLERLLHNELTGGDIQLSDKTARQAYGVKLDNRLGFLGFVRHVLDLDAMPDYEAVVASSFQDHITRHNYTGDQIRFLRAVQDVFLAKRRLAEADLYEAPLTNFGRNAVERFFTPDEIKDIVALTEQLAALRQPCSPIRNSAPRSKPSGTSSGPAASPIRSTPSNSFPILLFLKQLDEREQDAERAARCAARSSSRSFHRAPKLRWSHWSQLPAEKALKHVKEKVFPFLKNLGDKAGSFGEQMANAEFKINKPSLLIEACRAIEGMDISGQNQDVQGDLYEYLLGKLNTAGTNGQFRTPRHIIRMMVKMLDPRPGERVCDPAAGTCGFLVNAWQHLLETHTDPRDLTYDEEGWPHGLTGSRLGNARNGTSAQTRAFTGYDSDSGMTMLRIGSMNLMLHGLTSPRFRYTDTLSKAFNEERAYDIVLANPPFKGAIDAADVNPSLPAKCKKTEILFLHLFLRLLENGGRAAVIVPDGVLFGSSNAHVEIRKKLIEENRLDGVVSMPSGVFRPYAGVSTAVLLVHQGRSHRAHLVLRHGARRLLARRQAPARAGERHPRPAGLLAAPARREVPEEARRPPGRPAKADRPAQGGPPRTPCHHPPAEVRGSGGRVPIGRGPGEAEPTRPAPPARRPKPNWRSSESADRPAGKGNQPARPPVLGDQGASGRQEIRPLRQPLPAGRTGRSLLRKARRHAGADAATRHVYGCCGERNRKGTEMKVEPIGNLVGHVTQCQPAKLGRESITYLDISSVDRETKRIVAPERIAVGSAPSRARQQVYADDVLISTVRPNLNAVAVVPRQFDGEVASTGFCVLRPSKDRVCPQYLFYFAQTDRFVSHLTRISTGATYPAVTDNDVLETRIPLPGLSEQRRIAGQLEQADRLRRTRRYALELSDTFLPAAFLQLFGDPISNPRKWKSCYLGDVLLSAQDGPHVSPEYCERGIPFLSTRNVRPGELVWEDMKYISLKDAQVQWRKVKPEKGDVLYTKGGTTGMAKSVDFDQEVAVWVHIAVLKLRKELVVPLWLENMLNSRFCYQQSQSLTFGIVNRDLGLKRMPSICIYLPPVPMQEQFAKLVARHEHLRAVQREALCQAEHLFQSLLHRAFSRES